MLASMRARNLTGGVGRVERARQLASLRQWNLTSSQLLTTRNSNLTNASNVSNSDSLANTFRKKRIFLKHQYREKRKNKSKAQLRYKNEWLQEVGIIDNDEQPNVWAGKEVIREAGSKVQVQFVSIKRGRYGKASDISQPNQDKVLTAEEDEEIKVVCYIKKQKRDKFVLKPVQALETK